MQFNVHEAKTQFSRLLDLALEGEKVVITRNGAPVVELVPARSGGIQLGAGRAETQTKDDGWWTPMNDKEVEDFLEGRS